MTTVPEPSIFTKIINREIPADIVYEDEHVIAFFTIEPINPGHTLVVPKKPFRNLLDGDDEVLGRMTIVAKKIANVLVNEGFASGINLIMNNETDADQEVFHAHMHVVPRIKHDGALVKPKHAPHTLEQIKTIATVLQTKLR
jgi:histidine triad (HIT) family protein